MRVEMTTRIGGYRNLEPWPEVGGCVDLPDHEAADLIAAGYAKEATDADDAPPAAEVDSDPEATDADPEPSDDEPTPVAEEPLKRRTRTRK